jgi:hypothetical protein
LLNRFLNAAHSWQLALLICCATLAGGVQVRAEQLPTAEFDIPYQIRVLQEGIVLEISGSFSWALPQTFQATLSAAPNVRVIRLESPGGYIQPALQIAEIIRGRHLNTFVGHFCASACTIAFVAGQQRWLGQEARLGFHQARAPGLPAELTNGYLQEAYRRLGMPAPFVAQVLRTPADDIWLPSRSELKAARLITDLPTATTLVADDDGSRSLRDVSQFAQTASGDTITLLAAELSELLQRLQDANPEACWIFAHDGLADLRAFVPETLLDALKSTHQQMAEEARNSTQPPLSSQNRRSFAEHLVQMMRQEGLGAALEGLRSNADPSRFCPSIRGLLLAALQLPEPMRIQTLRAILPRS